MTLNKNDNKEMVPVKERDYLDQDPELRGQKYVCMSFLSPEDVIQQKEVFFFNKYISSFSKDLSELFQNLSDRFKEDSVVVDMISNIKDRYDYVFTADNLQKEYDFWKSTNISTIENEYLEKNNFQTSVRGIKMRGVYETLLEAKNRATSIKRFDPKFDVFVGEVGCWCPWSPYAEDVADQEYAETQLNTLMKKYRENLEIKDEFYRVRMEEMVSKVKQSNDVRKDEGVAISTTGESTSLVEIAEGDEEKEENATFMSAPDPWAQRKLDSQGASTSGNQEADTLAEA